MFEWITDPTIWVGLITLVTLEIILGIDNLIFIAILADKLPPARRDRARVVGLGLALIMRLALLAGISWVVSLTRPLFSVFGLELSGRDLILLAGGLFLLFKATMELHERLEGEAHRRRGAPAYAGFGVVVAQIVALDAVFSLDSVITAVGMVNDLPVMMIAVVIAVIAMIVASKPLTAFVGAHPTVVVLCLGFLLLVGFSLMAEGVGFHIPKGYLYAAIGFSVLIEVFNQIALANRRRLLAGESLRERTAEAVLRLLGGQMEPALAGAEGAAVPPPPAPVEGSPAFAPAERGMVRGVLQLSQRDVEAVMTPRPDIVWLDARASAEEIRAILRRHPHNRFLVGRGSLDELLGVVEARELLAHLLEGQPLDLERLPLRQPLALPEGMSALQALEAIRKSPVPVAVVVDEYGTLEGLVTADDLLAAIAGESEHDARDDIVPEGEDGWLLDGGLELDRLEQLLGVRHLAGDEDFHTLAGLVLARLGRIPEVGDGFDLAGYRFEVTDMEHRRVARVRVRRNPPPPAPSPETEEH
jgi:CBS domain containing-hemolysin-like protein